MISTAEQSPGTPQRRCSGERRPSASARAAPMFNFSANHLFLLLRTEYRSCAANPHARRRHAARLHVYDFSKRWLPRPRVGYCVPGKVNSADRLFLVVDWQPPSTGFIPMLLFLLTAREVGYAIAAPFAPSSASLLRSPRPAQVSLAASVGSETQIAKRILIQCLETERKSRCPF